MDFRLKPIHTKRDHELALAEVERLMTREDAETNDDVSEKIEVLATLIAAYETRTYPIAPPDPVEAIRFRMEQAGLTRTDLAEALGSRMRVSEVLSRKRELSKEMIRRLHEKFGIPLASLMHPMSSKSKPSSGAKHVRQRAPARACRSKAKAQKTRR